MFEDIEFNETALGVGVLAAIFLGIFFFSDPFNMGFDRIPLFSRIISIVVVALAGYFVALKKLDD